MTYTILSNNGLREQGLSLQDAASSVMTYDGHVFEIRKSDDGSFELWTSPFSRNSTAFRGLEKSAIFSLERDEETAAKDIYQQVIEHADWWMSQEVLTDKEYARRLKECEGNA